MQILRNCFLIFNLLILTIFFLWCSSPTDSNNNSIPTIELLSPLNGATDVDTSITIRWTADDADNDNITYDFYIDSVRHIDSVKRITGWLLNVKSIKNEFYQLSGLKYNTKYYWVVCAKDGKDSSISKTYNFTTKMKPITNQTFSGLWNEDGFVNDTLAYHFVLIFNSDMSFSFTCKNATTDLQINTYTGVYSITSGTTLKFDYTSTTYADAYMEFSFSASRNILYLTHVSGFDFMNSKAGTEWSYSR